jgi:hypothetical protein
MRVVIAVFPHLESYLYNPLVVYPAPYFCQGIISPFCMKESVIIRVPYPTIVRGVYNNLAIYVAGKAFMQLFGFPLNEITVCPSKFSPYMYWPGMIVVEGQKILFRRIVRKDEK